MSKITFDVQEADNYSLISFETEGVIAPEDLRDLVPPQIDATKGAVLSGRGPIWLYCFLTHFYHPTKFVATNDPRLGGAVIVETHSTEYAIGSIFNYDELTTGAKSHE